MPNCWRLSYNDENIGNILEWFNTKPEYISRRRALTSENPETSFYEVNCGKVFIPVGRAAMVSWLNANLSTDNG